MAETLAAEATALAPGLRVKVHYNLNHGGFSVTVGGHVAAVVPDITLVSVTFRVQPGGLARIRREHRRQVCAYATGVIEAVATAPNVARMQRVTINPHRDDTFVLPDGTAVHAAPRVVFAADPANAAARPRPGYGWVPMPPVRVALAPTTVPSTPDEAATHSDVTRRVNTYLPAHGRNE